MLTVKHGTIRILPADDDCCPKYAIHECEAGSYPVICSKVSLRHELSGGRRGERCTL